MKLLKASSSVEAVSHIKDILGFVKVGNRQPGSKPGFSHALQLTYNLIDQDVLSWNENEKVLTYRLRFPSSLTNRGASVGLLMAQMDELTTMAIFAAGNPAPPGASLQMQTELVGSGAQKLADMQEIDCVSRVAKQGRKISFTSTEFLNPSTGEVLAHGSHVKYMPTGSLFLDYLFSNRLLYSLYLKWVKAESVTPDTYPVRSIEDAVATHLQHQALGRALFTITREHTNPFGALHGGCQAFLVEAVALPLAKAELRSENAIVTNLSVDYIAAARLGQTVSINCRIVGRMQSSSTLSVGVRISRADGRVVTESRLTFRTAHAKL